MPWCPCMRACSYSNDVWLGRMGINVEHSFHVAGPHDSPGTYTPGDYARIARSTACCRPRRHSGRLRRARNRRLAVAGRAAGGARRQSLKGLVTARHPRVQLVEQLPTSSLRTTGSTCWRRSRESSPSGPTDGYAPGRGRDWVKVKRFRTIDCVIIGVAGDWTAPTLVLGLQHSDGLHHLGMTRPLQPALLGPLAPLLEHIGPDTHLAACVAFAERVRRCPAERRAPGPRPGRARQCREP